ncbi:MAG TPA: MBL fold metallo-hydrolase [Gryllotalpicola sp.]
MTGEPTIEPVSAAEFDAFSRGVLPEPAEVAAGVFLVPVPFPPGSGLVCTFCYLVVDEHGVAHLIDAGHRTDEGERAVAAALDRFGLSSIATITVTHLHPDHLGMAGLLAERYGAQLALHEVEWRQLRAQGMATGGIVPDLDAWGVPDAERATLPPVAEADRGRVTDGRADILLTDGELLPIPGRQLRVIATPGHTAGHICLHDEESGVVFTGDHVLPRLHPGLGLGGPGPAASGPGTSGESNPIRAALASLRRVRELPAGQVCPGHEYRFTGLRERCDQLIAHHLRRSAEVAAVLAAEPQASVWRIAGAIGWSAGWERLRRERFVYSALAQTAMHVDYLRTEAGA